MKSFLFNQFLKLRYRKLIQQQRDPHSSQQKAFLRLKKSMTHTEMGRKFKISEFDNYKDFVKSVPPQTYGDLKWAVDSQIHHPEMHALSGEPVKFIGLSSGTTAEKKQIPYTPSLIKAFTKFQLDVASILHHDFKIEPLKSKRVSWGTTPVLDQHATGIDRGYISGFLSINAPKITRPLSFPQESVSRINDMKAKAAAALEEVRGENIEFLLGVPSYILGLAEDFKALDPEIDLKKLWPQCRVLAYSAMGIEPFEHRLKEVFGEQLRFLGTYITTEGPFGYQIPSLHSKNYFLNFRDILFSFRSEETGEIKTLEELLPGETVEVLVSTPNGMIQYSLGDMLQVRGTAPYFEFTVCGRKGQALNLASEKMTQSQLNEAFSLLQKEHGLPLEHFFVYPAPTQGRPAYEIALTSKNQLHFENLKSDDLVKLVDQALAQVSEQYSENRFELSLLDLPRVRVLPHEPLQNFFDEKSSQGQLKIKSVFTNVEEFLKYVEPIYGKILETIDAETGRLHNLDFVQSAPTQKSQKEPQYEVVF